MVSGVSGCGQQQYVGDSIWKFIKQFSDLCLAATFDRDQPVDQIGKQPQLDACRSAYQRPRGSCAKCFPDEQSGADRSGDHAQDRDLIRAYTQAGEY
jgi:hypothetical protein